MRDTCRVWHVPQPIDSMQKQIRSRPICRSNTLIDTSEKKHTGTLHTLGSAKVAETSKLAKDLIGRDGDVLKVEFNMLPSVIKQVGSLAAAIAVASVVSLVSFPFNCYALRLAPSTRGHSGPWINGNVSQKCSQRPSSPFGVSVPNSRCERCQSQSTLHSSVPRRRASSSIILAAAARPAVLERPSGITTIEKTIALQDTKAAPINDKRRVGNESWEVRIYNDRTNTREHVARCLVRVIGLSETSAYNTMMQAHQHGIAVVGTWVFERAEMYYEALKQSGIICDLNPVDGAQ
jgi:ATP-dependent Clp protease adaptor protein ClpS